MIRLITPPLPAVSRPSNRTTTRRLRFRIHSSSCTSSTCRRLSSLSYSLRVSARFCFFLAGMRLTLAWSDHLRRLCLRVADVARPQDLVDGDRAQGPDAQDADGLHVGRLAAAAEQGADGGGETVAHEGAAEVARQVALHDAADREDMAGVLGHQHDRDEPEEAERADGVAEVWECELRVADPVGAADYRCVDVAARRGRSARAAGGLVEPRDDVADDDP